MILHQSMNPLSYAIPQKRVSKKKNPLLFSFLIKVTFEGANRIPFLVTHDISVAYIYYEIHENTFETLCRNM